MPKSVVVTGPQGCGKTFNADKLKAKYGLKKVVDGWEVNSFAEASGVLYLTNYSYEYCKSVVGHRLRVEQFRKP